MAVFQTIFRFSFQVRGRCFALVCPSPVGPRNCHQSSSADNKPATFKAMTIHRALLMRPILSVERRGLQPQPGYVVSSVANLVDKARDKQMRAGKQQIGE